MTYNQKEKIKSLIKNDKTENILRRIIRNDNFPNYNISRRYIATNNDKNQSLLAKIPFYSIKRKHFPNTTKNSSIQKKQKDKLISESLNSNKLSTSSSISQLNNNLRQLKNYSSSKDFTSNCQYNNHSIFISGQAKTPNGNYHIKIATDKNNKYTKTIPKNLNQNFQFYPSTSTALYKRRGERKEERKLNSNDLYSSLTNIRGIYTNDFNNYRLNSITCKASSNHKISYNFSKNLSNNNYDYFNDSKTFHSQSKYSYGTRRNEVNKSQNENKEKYTFNPKNLLKDENLICERLKKNINMDKKFKILSINNSSKASNFFFNPLKYQKSIKNEISSNTLKKNHSNEKIKIGFNRSLLQKSDSNHAIKITNESKNKINTSKLITRKDRKEYKFDITERFKKEIHININKDKIKKLNNKRNNNKNNVNNNGEKECNKVSISEDLRNHMEQINITEIDPEWFKNENNFKDPSYFEKLKAYELKRMGIKQLKLSDFLIGKKLGSGQFGHVYLAKLKSTQFICAIKVINKNRLLKESLKCINQVRREIEIQSHLHHPNILSIYNFFWDKKNVYLVIEYALGGELFKLLRKEPNGRFSEPKAAFYIKQVCEGIEYIHKMHIIHRDIKPENILVCNEVIKLADFGWSIHQISNKLRKTFCGTPEYMPPEVLYEQPHIPSSDLWCLGVLIFELCSGETPFNGNSNSEIIYKIKKFKMKAFPNYFSEDVKDLIGKLLKRSPNERISIEEVKAHPWITKNAQKYVIK